MLRRGLKWLAVTVSRSPRAAVLFVLIPTLGLAAAAPLAHLDLTFIGLMDRSHPEVSRYLRQSDALGFGGSLLVRLRSEEIPEKAESELAAASRDLQRALESRPEVAAVVDPQAGEWLLGRALWLVSVEDFDALTAELEQRLSAPLGGRRSDEGGEWASAETTVEDGGPWRASSALLSGRVPGERILQVMLREDPLTQEFGDDTYDQLLPVVREAVDGHAIEFELSGLPAVAAQDQSRTLGIIRRLSPISLALVLFLVLIVDRRPRILFAVVGALLLAVGATLGLIGLLTGRLTLMETFFGVTVFGLGIDFAIHLLLRLRSERRAGRSVRRAVDRALSGTGRGVVAGAVTTAGAFLVLTWSPDPVATHLGLSGGLGLLFCLGLMVVLVSVAWSTAESGRGTPNAPRHAELPPSFVDRLAALPRWIAGDAVRRPRRHLAVAAALLVGAAAGMPRFAVEAHMEKVFNRDVPAVATVNEIRERFGLSGAPWILPAANLAEARRLADGLRGRSDAFASVASPSDLVPADVEESRRRSAVLEPLAEQARRLLAATPPPLRLAAAQAVPGFESLPAQLRLLEVLVSGIERGPPEAGALASELPPALAFQFLGVGAGESREQTAEGPWLVHAYARESTFDAHAARRARLAAQEVHPEATGISALLEAVLLGPRPWIWRVGAAILGFVALVLIVDLRSLRDVGLALVPVCVASSATFGVLCWLPMNFNVMTLVVVPLLVGLGVDDGIHVVHRMREGLETPDQATAAVGAAILMTTATTCASFAVLLFTDHPGLESMALVMLVGLPLCFLASVSTLPAVAALSSRGDQDRTGQATP